MLDIVTRLSESAGLREQGSEAKRILWGWQGKFLGGLLQNLKCHDSRDIDNLLFYKKYTLISIFGNLLSTLWEAWPLKKRGPAFLWNAWPSCERPGLPVTASLYEARPSCERPDLPARGLASLLEAQFPGERPSLPVRGPASLWEAWPHD